MLDRYLFGGTSRISPEAPVPVVHVRDNEDRAGGAANVATNLARLGVKTHLLGIVGDDDEAQALQDSMQGSNVTCTFTPVDGWPTITKTRVQSRGQQLIRIDREEPVPSGSEALTTSLREQLDGADAVVLSDYGKGSLSDVAAMIAACRDAGVPAFVDPKGRDFDKYQGATLITPNQSEFDAVAGESDDDADMVARARAMADRLELSALLVTRSEKGMLLIEGGDEPLFLSTRAREGYDVTGAGDTVIAHLALYLGDGLDLKTAVRLANHAAGIVVARLGTNAVTRGELAARLRDSHSELGSVLAGDALDQALDNWRAEKKRIVFTNGCFDILHAGPVQYLREAKSFGDVLLVGVNDDASVKRLKGESRPVNSLEDRMAVLSALEMVDAVTFFGEDTPKEIIQRVTPDVLVKGEDWADKGVVGREWVESHGGVVHLAKMVPGRSTTGILERAQKQK